MTNRYNLIMKINAKNQVKALLSYENVKLKDLVVKMSELSGKKYTSDGLSHKLSRNRLTYDEMLLIAEILGYSINFTK